MEVTGILKVKFDTQVVSEKFKKREMVLTITEGPSGYQQFVTFQLTQDKVNIIDQYNEGDEIKVQFNLRGREWISPQNEKKYFNTLEAWKIERAGTGNSTQSSVAAKPTTDVNINISKDAGSAANINSFNVSDDDLPF